MLKWIGGGLLVLVMLAAGFSWYGYKAVTAGGNSVEVAMAAPAEHVFAALTDTDSMALWMPEGTTITPRGRGPLQVGDTLHLSGRLGDNPNTTRDMSWTVGSVSAPHLIVLQLRDDSLGRVITMRRDSVFRRGDSTIVRTMFESPMMDSVRTKASDSSQVAGAIMGGTVKLMVGAFRMSAEQELKLLKAHVEGVKVP